MDIAQCPGDGVGNRVMVDGWNFMHFRQDGWEPNVSLAPSKASSSALISWEFDCPVQQRPQDPAVVLRASPQVPWALLQFYSTGNNLHLLAMDGFHTQGEGQALLPFIHVGVGVTHAPHQAPWACCPPDSESEGTSKVIHRCLLAFHHPRQIAIGLLF